MKIIKLLYLSILLSISCIAHSQQSAFKKILGKENNNTLNVMLDDLENNILKTKYPNLTLKKAYKQLLNDIANGTTFIEEVRSKKIKTLFDQSNLKKQIYCLPDSVYVGPSKYASNKDRKAVITIFKCVSSDNEVSKTRAEFYGIEKNGNFKKTIEHARNSDQLNLTGSFFKALKATKNKSVYLKKHLAFAENMGDVRHPTITCEILLKENSDLTDFIIKRLILVYILYRY